MTRLMVGKSTVKCTDSVTLTKVLHAPLFFINLLSLVSLFVNRITL
jgi:hypothetical protein